VIVVAVASLLGACAPASGGVAAPIAPTTNPAQPDAKPEGGDVDTEGTSCVVEGQKVSFGELQHRLGELVVEPLARSTSNLVNRDGSFGGTEEHHVARRTSDGAEFDYMIVRTSTHHHYEISLVKEGNGRPAPPSPAAAAPEHLSIAGTQVDAKTFEAKLATLDVEAEPWVSAHTQSSDGMPGTAATYQARDRKTGELWTLHQEGNLGRSSRALARGSAKPPPRPRR
jgi:hypothetical protein